MQYPKINVGKFITFVVLVVFVFALQLQAQTSQPLTLAQILTGLQAKSDILNTTYKKNRKIAADVEMRGISFKLIPEFETVLRNAGANNTLISAIRRKGVEPTEKPNSSAQTFFNSAESFRKANKPDLAIRDYTKAISLDPDFTRAYYYRGYSNILKGNYDSAFEDYTKTIELDPKFAVAYLERGKIYNRKGTYDLAIAEYDKAIELDPKSASAFYERGLSYLNKGNYTQTLNDSSKAINLRPDFAYAYINRGISYMKGGTYYMAIRDYSKAIEIDPKYDSAYNLRGEAYIARGYKGDDALAIADYRKALQLNSKNTSAKSNLDKLLQKTDGNPTIKKTSRTIKGGVVNGKAISLPKPKYPAVNVRGAVTVSVLIDESGRVISARAISGHPLLRATSVAAARRAKFRPTKLSGQPVKVDGVLVYRF